MVAVLTFKTAAGVHLVDVVTSYYEYDIVIFISFYYYSNNVHERAVAS